MSIKIYTAVVGGKDKVREDITCFTGYDKFKRPVMNAKIYKILPWQFMDDDLSIWVDGNIELLTDPWALAKHWLKNGADMAVWEHHGRTCVYDEAKQAKGLFHPDNDKPIIQEIDEQAAYYQHHGFPVNCDTMAECNVIVRKHNDRVKAFCNDWWAEICRFSQRDQLSFPVVLQRHPELKINFIAGNPRNHPDFKYTPHNV